MNNTINYKANICPSDGVRYMIGIVRKASGCATFSAGLN